MCVRYKYLIGIVVPIYNRSDIGCFVLDRLSKSIFKYKTLVLLLDDGSTEEKIINKIKNIKFPKNVTLVKQFKQRNNINYYHNIGKNILYGFDYLIKQKCKYIMNLDDDMLVKPDFINTIMKLSKEINIDKNGGFIVGFLETNNWKKGNFKMYKDYPMLAKQTDSQNYIIRAFGGGCNHFMTNKSYLNIYRPALYKSIQYNIKWDDYVVKKTKKLLENEDRNGIWYSPRQGIMQHLGFVGLNRFAWDFDYIASMEDIEIFKKLNIKKPCKFNTNI